MDDYELINAQSWAEPGSTSPAKGPAADGWQVVKSAPRRPITRVQREQDPSSLRITQNKFSRLAVKVPADLQASSDPSHALPPNVTPRNALHARFQQLLPGHSTYKNAKTNQQPRKELLLTQYKPWGAPQPSHLRRRGPPRILSGSDSENDAQALWRERKDPNAYVQIPTDIALHDRGFLSIAAELRTFIHTEELKSGAKALIFGIWGEASNAAATKRQIIHWVAERSPSKREAGVASFAKVVSLTPQLREKAERSWAREVRRQRFRQYPPETMAFGAVGTFHWPANDYRAEEILGTSYQALDPIRMDCSCYVVFIKERSLFQVMGNAQNVKKALARIRKVCFQIAARQTNPTRAYLLQLSASTNMPSHIYLEPYQYPKIIAPVTAAEIPPSMSPRSEGFLEDEGQIEKVRKRTDLNIERMHVTIASALRKLHFYHGYMQLRLRLGTFILKSFYKPVGGAYVLDEYVAMTGASQFRGTVTEEFCHGESGSKILNVMQACDDILAPQDLTTNELAKIKPVYSAVFLFEEATANLRLSISWNQASKTDGSGGVHLEIAEKRWTRYERESGRDSSLIDMSLTDVHSGRAWEVELVAAQAVDTSRLPKDLANFPDKIKVRAGAALGDKPMEATFFTFHQHPKLKSVRQMISYRYGIKATDYTLELSQFQDRDFTICKSLAEKAQSTVYEPCWSINVYRVEWDTMFSQNERLPIGEGADWEDTMETWFPADIGPSAVEGSDGFTMLVNKLGRIGEVVKQL